MHSTEVIVTYSALIFTFFGFGKASLNLGFAIDDPKASDTQASSYNQDSSNYFIQDRNQRSPLDSSLENRFYSLTTPFIDSEVTPKLKLATGSDHSDDRSQSNHHPVLINNKCHDGTDRLPNGECLTAFK